MFDFRDVKAGELTRHVQHCEGVVDHVKKGNLSELKAIEEEIGRITCELSQLATFSRINYTGFIKILKKHDKHTAYILKPMFMLRLNSKPLYLENLDSLIFRLSKLYDRIRSDDPSRRSPTAPQGGSEQTQVFVRKTSKYWVHADNVTEVKCFVLRYLPVLIFPNRKRKIDLAVSSVYLDNDEMELYKGRLEKTEGAMAIRLRWYGSDEPREVFVERKIHREDWTGEVSVKERFPIKEKHLNDYLSGEFVADDVIRKLAKDGKRSEKELEDLGRLAKEIQDTILEKKLRPRLRTFYNRTAFQLPGDARVRISLDTELTMIREDGPRRSGDNWKRDDIFTSDYPFSHLSGGEFERFPHAVLEVKLQMQSGQEPPQWVETLIGSHLVEEVPKFSKYIHGCATLFPQEVSMIPFWLPQMDVDIRKPPPGDLEDESEDEGEHGASSEDLSSPGRGEFQAGVNDNPHMIIPLNTAEETETTPLLPGAPNLAPPKPTGILALISSKPGTADHSKGPQSLISGGGTQSGSKKIQIPVRVEPKVFFANERTFLSWVHFSIFLGGIATALVGLGHERAKYSGFLFGIVSVLFASYALYLYQWRASRIRERDPGPYDDRVGPTFVVIVFLLAMIVNLAFTIG